MNITLRPYQQDGVNQIRSRFSAGDRNVLYQLPTGGGKTVVFSHITEGAARKGNRVYILAHRAELVRQSSDSLHDIGVHHGVIAPGYSPDPLALVQVASVQTLAKRLNRIIPPQLIIVDEAHHATRKTKWGQVIDHFSGSARVIGVTATPVRLSGEGLGRGKDGFFDSMITGPSVAELIEQGHLARPAVFCPPVGADLSNLRMTAGEFNKGQLKEVMDKPTITGCAVGHYRSIVQGAPAIAFCASVEHAEHLAEQFRSAGYTAASIYSKLHPLERKRRIADLGSGVLNVLTSCEVISEGTDIPRVVAAILLRPTASLGLYMQQVGRVLRPFPGKSHSIVLDHVMNTYRHGFVDDPREWTLDASRKGQKSQQERELAGRQCMACYAFHAPAPVCPMCGEVYPVKSREIKEVDGELQELDRERWQKIEEERARKQERIETWRAGSYEELKAIEIKRGYKKGWARIQIAIRERMEAE